MKLSTWKRVVATLFLCTLPAVGQASQAASVSVDDPDGLQAAIEAARHAVRPAGPGQYRVHNPGQRWLTHFDGRGFTVQPGGDAWSWGLQLECYGLQGVERPVSTVQHVLADGGRVAYTWDDTLTEWFVNDARGLEHGYTVQRRPDVGPGERAGSQRGPLTFHLSVRGGLVPEVLADGRGVRFEDDRGRAIVSYTGLVVTDGDGTALSARFEPLDGGLVLAINERGARYPLTIDPVAQQVYLKATAPGDSDQFGIATAISGDTVVIGAFHEDSAATGVGGDPTDNGAPSAGAAYVFVREGTSWVEQAYLKASNSEAGDAFGSSVAISGDTVAVGAPNESSRSVGVNGLQSNNNASQSGAVYVFVRQGTTWTQQAYVKASNTSKDDHFGGDVSLSGDTLAVSATYEDSAATGVNGNQINNDAPDSGAVYVFVRSGTTWSQQAYLKASNAEAEDLFGMLALSGDTLVVGASREDSAATGVDGDQGNGSFASGAAYVFVRQGTTWSQQAYLKASDALANDHFGLSVAVSADTVVVGAPEPTFSINRRVYVFERSGLAWAETARLVPLNPVLSLDYGNGVAVSGSRVVVAASQEGSGATGVDGDQFDGDSTAPHSGAVFVYIKDGATWVLEHYLKASHTDGWDFFGRSVALSDETLVVGASSEDSGVGGVGGDPLDDSATDAGAAYVFEFFPEHWVDLGGGTVGSNGPPTLDGAGPLTPGSLNPLTLTGAPPGAPNLCLIAFQSSPLDVFGGTLHAFPYDVQILFFADGRGSFSVAVPWPAGVPPGTDIWFQFLVEDPSVVFGLTLSNAVMITTP